MPTEILVDFPPVGDDGEIHEPAPGRALQQVRTQFCTAMTVQQPRQLGLVQRRLLEEARIAGEEFYYGWGAGKSAIEGPSVKLAMALARCWGNCVVQMQPVQDLEDSWVFTASFVDLETGFTLDRQFRQSKQWKIHGKFDADRADDMRFQIGQSKAVRNVILNALPSSLTARALTEAKSGVRAKIEGYIEKHGLAKATDIALGALAKVGVNEAQVLKKFSVADRNGLSVEHLVTIKGDLSAIEGGQDRADVLYPALEQPQAKKPAGNGQQQPAQQQPEPKPVEAAPEPAKPQLPPTLQSDQPGEGAADKIAELRDRIAEAGDTFTLGEVRSEIEDARAWIGDAAYAELQDAAMRHQAVLLAPAGKEKKRR